MLIGSTNSNTLICTAFLRHYKEIPTASYTFLGFSFSMELWRTLLDIAGSQNKAVAKPEVLISAPLGPRNESQTATLAFFGSSFSIKLLRPMLNVTGKQKSSNSVDKPEVLV
jgi:hypothetical protein